jgi:hypothetical protein
MYGTVTRKELQVMYNKSEHVIRRWIREAGISHRLSLKPLEFEILKSYIGSPIKNEKGA